MSYTCPDCEDGILEAKIREVDLKLENDETARIAGGVALITSVRCNNGCSAENDEEEEEEKPKQRKKRTPAATADAKACDHEGCIRSAGHAGSHYRKVEK
jgi:hypothetical protein